jgi:hypothetical protein
MLKTLINTDMINTVMINTVMINIVNRQMRKEISQYSEFLKT